MRKLLTYLKDGVPWWGKIGLKLALARIPVPYRLFSMLGIFRHGDMDSASYALGVFLRHQRYAPDAPWVGLELGPGDSIFSAILARRYGCQKLWLVDAGDFAIKTPQKYRKMAEELEASGAGDELLALASADDFAALLTSCGAAYLTSGLAALRSIEPESVDLVWSHAVLEHVRAGDFAAFAREMYRILRPGGCASHVVDFKDHLGGSLNNMRIPSSLWEQDWFAQRSGFYTNRIRFQAMEDAFAESGFSVEVLLKNRWDQPPVAREAMAPEFRDLDPQDLLVSDCHFLLRKPCESSCQGQRPK